MKKIGIELNATTEHWINQIALRIYYKKHPLKNVWNFIR